MPLSLVYMDECQKSEYRKGMREIEREKKRIDNKQMR
jgi:hypothetical protein